MTCRFAKYTRRKKHEIHKVTRRTLQESCSLNTVEKSDFIPCLVKQLNFDLVESLHMYQSRKNERALPAKKLTHQQKAEKVAKQLL